MSRRLPPSSNLRFRPSAAARTLRERQLVGGPLPPLYKATPSHAYSAKRRQRSRIRARAQRLRAAIVDCLAAVTIFTMGSYLATTLGASTVRVMASASASPSPPPQQVVTLLRQAIIGQESLGTGHSTVNLDGSGALGLGQVMPENLPSWSQECLGRSLAPDEFLQNHSLQVQLIDCKLLEFWTEEQFTSAGDEDRAVRRVASRWYSGQADLYDSTDRQSWAGTTYPSVQAYTYAVLDKYRMFKAASL